MATGRDQKATTKVDVHLLPILVIMYLLNFLDRTNLAQARLRGTEKDLGMTGTDFNLATSILFVGYLTMQPLPNLLIARFKPSIYLGSVMTVWGTVSAAQASVTIFGGLLVARIMPEVTGVFLSGAILLISSFYTTSELAHRIA